MLKPIRTMTSVAVMAMMTSHVSHAGGFSLYTESSAAAIGNYAAGIAAEGADASIGWYNPAGLVLIKEQQVLLGGVGVFPSTTLTGTASNTTVNPLGPPNFPYSQSFSGQQAAKNALVPSLHYALPLGERAAFGLSIVAPFGLSTDYSSTSPLRYAATLSQFETYNVSPEIGGKLTDHFSIGVGLDLQYATVKFNSMTGAPGVVDVLSEGAMPSNIADSQSYNTGNSFGVGFHAGGLLMFNDNQTRVGLNYQSTMRHQFSGQSLLTGKLADPTFYIPVPDETGNPNASFKSNTLLSNNISLPNVVTLSGYQDVNANLALLGSVIYSGWSSFKTITLNNVAAGIPIDGGTELTLLNVTTKEHYRDAWRFALGVNYHVTDTWMMRVGGGYDETPTVDAYRDVRLPDCDRWALSIGAHYQALPSVGFDVGYTYLFAVNDAKVNSTLVAGPSIIQVDAISKNHAQLFGLQVVWTIDKEKAPKTK